MFSMQLSDRWLNEDAVSYIPYNRLSHSQKDNITVMTSGSYERKLWDTLHISSELSCAGYYAKHSRHIINVIRIPCDEIFLTSIAVCETKYKVHEEGVRITQFNTGITLNNNTLLPYFCSLKYAVNMSKCLDKERNPDVCLNRDIIARSCIDGVMYEYNKCRRNQFRCNDGECIAEKYVCDGIGHCMDKSDEKTCSAGKICNSSVLSGFTSEAAVMYCLTNCKTSKQCQCQENYFHCVSGGCIPVNKFCDRTPHCQDYSDEIKCSYRKCNVDEFRCKNHKCIANILLCNSFNDCADNSDEHQCSSITLHNPLLVAHKRKDDLFNCSYEPFHVSMGMVCILTYDRYGVVRGCPNGKHLEDCESFQCDNHYKCEQSYCIPVNYICNSKVDCPHGDDEVNCSKYRCPGLFRCNNGKLNNYNM